MATSVYELKLLDVEGVEIVHRFECQKCHRVETYTDGEYVPLDWLIISWKPMTSTMEATKKILCPECKEYFGIFLDRVEPTDQGFHEQDQDTVETPRPLSGDVL